LLTALNFSYFFDKTQNLKEIDGRKVFEKLKSNLKIFVEEESKGKLIVWSKNGRKVSKKVRLNSKIILDELFFEGLGLWIGDGSKQKGIYFGNTEESVLLHFLKFLEERIGLERKDFKVIVHTPGKNKNLVEKWSKILEIPKENFVKVVEDRRINKEYVQIYFNSIVLLEFFKKIWEMLKNEIERNEAWVRGFLRGIFAAEGEVILKPKTKTLFFIGIATGNQNFAEYLRKLFKVLGINTGKYIKNGRRITIYGRKNFEKIKRLRLHVIHVEKMKRFEFGIGNYQRNVEDFEEVEKRILKLLYEEGAKTYKEIAKAVGKARSTIQSHYLRKMLEKELVKYVGKRKRSLLFEISEKGKEVLFS